MNERPNVCEEIEKLRFSSFNEIFGALNRLSEQYGNLPTSSLINAFSSVGVMGSSYTPDPVVQNRRVKAISSLPETMTKDKVSEMLKNPDCNEKLLRQTAHALEYTAYPLFHTRKVYQELLTYHNYIAPHLVDEKDTKKEEFWREWKLLEKVRHELDASSFAHEASGQALVEGKTFYHPRVSVDKAHNKVNYAFVQQLPSDWCKIVGFNNKSKYTVAFDLMYFTNPGTDPLQFGDLFTPFLSDFESVVIPERPGAKMIYASRAGINLRELQKKRFADGKAPNAYYQNGRWFYWVTLPIDEVFTFEVDDVSRNAISPFAALFIDLIQLSQLAAIQLSLVQNPLVSVLTGEIPYFEDKGTNTVDQYKLSNGGRLLFESLWYKMLSANNTNGIGLFAAPYENMKLHTLSETPSAMDIVSKGYTDTMSKAGLTGIIPVTADTRAGAVNVSLKIESRFASPIYSCMERMMNCIIERLNLKYEFKFRMFGDLASDKDTEEECIKGMERGLLTSAIIHNALHDRSILDDICWSSAVMNSGLLDKRIPLITSYSAKNGDGILPPQKQSGAGGDEGGRPTSGDTATSEGHEGDLDSPQTMEG